jgi:hypothetical protein
MANIMLQTKKLSDPKTVGINWVTKFVKRYLELRSVFNRKLDYQRAECEDPQVIGLWFKLVQDTILQYGVLDEDIYNFDKTGFQMGVISISKMVTTSERRGRARTVQPGNRELVTSIEAINSKGWTIPPFVIFAGKMHLKAWY